MTQTVFHKRRLLLVDDQQYIRECVKMGIEECGHDVQVADSGETGLQEYQRGKYDVVIVDYFMPTMKGDALALAIKKLNPRQPIIMATAHPEMVQGTMPGVDFIIYKPFMLKELLQAIERVAPVNP